MPQNESSAHDDRPAPADLRPADSPPAGENQPPPEPAPTRSYVAHEAAQGTVIAGRYHLAEKIGEGGMGEVWVARQTEPVKRKVALKLIKAGMDSKAVVQRFEHERQALALMDHPHIAKVLDGGITDEGRPFFVMELVNGLPLTKFCDGTKLGIRERLELFVPICQAVQHAHQKGIVHRDLKPSNILVTLIDGRPIPKVIDFGVAKATGGKLTDQTLSTQFGAVVGTLEYMSPEQAGFSGGDVDTRADIYSLGVILYELLTGLKPFDGQRLKQAALDEIVRIIREEEPSKPSTRLSTDEGLPSLAAARQIDPARLTKLLRGELDWVVMKCLEKQRDRRYETANALARDVQRYLADEPVEARPPSAGYRLRKLLRRNRGPVLAASLVFLALVVGVIGTTLGLFEAKRQEGLAIAAQHKEGERAEAEARERRRAEAAEGEALAQKRLAEANAAEALVQKANAEKNAAEAQKQEQEAKDKLALSAAVTEFLQSDLLGQAGSEAQADRKFEPDYNLTVKDALDRAASAVGEKFKDRPELEASIRKTVGDAYRAVGDSEKAIAQLEQSANIRQRLLGADHPETLGTLNSLGLAYLDAGKTSEAVALLERVRDARLKNFDSHESNTLTTSNNLAMAYRSAGKSSEAIALFEQVCDAMVTRLGPDHAMTLTTLNNLAMEYRVVGRTTDAILLHEQVRDAQVKILGPNHPSTLGTKMTLATAYAAAGKKTEAIALYEQVRDVQMKVLGPDHPLTLATLDNLGAAYGAAGRTKEAIRLLEQVRDAIVKKLGPDHPDTLSTINNLAAAYWTAKQLDKSIPMFEQLLTIQRQKQGESHPDTLTTMANLGVNYRDAGRFEKAIPLLQQAYLEHRDHAFLSWVGDALLAAYIRAGKNTEGIALAKDELQAARLALPAESLVLPEMLAKYGTALSALKAWPDAEQVLREWLALCELREPDAWTTFNARSILGEALLGQKKYADAEPLLLTGYEGMKQRAAKIPPQRKPRLTEALQRLVKLYVATGETEQASKWRKELETLQAGLLLPISEKP